MCMDASFLEAKPQPTAQSSLCAAPVSKHFLFS